MSANVNNSDTASVYSSATLDLGSLTAMTLPLVRRVFPTILPNGGTLITSEPIYTDPINKLMHEAGYDVPPDEVKTTTTKVPGLVDVQPMTLSTTGTIFYLKYKYGKKNRRKKKK